MLTGKQAGRVIEAAAKRAGISEDVTAHWLRHAHASHALAHGADIVEISNQLGHSSVGVTQVYVHIAPGKSTSRYLRI
jgi:integrase/recombinase XerD